MFRPPKPDSDQVRDIAPTGVRLPPELREALKRAASLNDRSLSQEITQRLRASFERSTSQRADKALAAGQPGEDDQPQPCSDTQRMLLTLFDAMEPDRQLALLTLLKR